MFMLLVWKAQTNHFTVFKLEGMFGYSSAITAILSRSYFWRDVLFFGKYKGGETPDMSDLRQFKVFRTSRVLRCSGAVYFSIKRLWLKTSPETSGFCCSGKTGSSGSLLLAGNVEVWLLKVAAVVVDSVLGHSPSAWRISVIRHPSILCAKRLLKALIVSSCPRRKLPVHACLFSEEREGWSAL